MALVAPIEVSAVWPLADVHAVVIRSVDGHGVIIPPGEYADVLVISPFSFCAQSVSEIICICADQVVVGVIVPPISGEETEEVRLRRPEICPAQGVRHAMKKTVTICFHTDNPKLLPRDVVANVIQITCLKCRSRIFGFTDATLRTVSPSPPRYR